MGIDLGVSRFKLPEIKIPNLRDPIKSAFEGILSPIDKLLKSGVSSILKRTIEPLLTLVFEKLKSFFNDLAFVASELISKTESMVTKLVDKILQGVSQLKAEVEGMVNNILIKVEDTVQKITQTVTNNLVNPFFQKIDALRESLVKDVKEVIDHAFEKADQIIDKGDRILTATIDTFRNEVLKFISFFPWDMPWNKDSCRRELNIQGVPGPELATGELYELLKCRRLKRFDEEKEIKSLKVNVVQGLYADLQDQAWHLACAARGTVTGVSSALKIEAIEDWIEFGKLHQLWNQFNENMSILDALNQKVQELDTKIAQFESKSAQLDALSTTIQEVQGTANTAVTLADAAQNTANDGVNRANNAQNTANVAQSKADNVNKEVEKLNGRVVTWNVHSSNRNTHINVGNKFLIAIGTDGRPSLWNRGSGNRMLFRFDGDVL